MLRESLRQAAQTRRGGEERRRGEGKRGRFTSVEGEMKPHQTLSCCSSREIEKNTDCMPKLCPKLIIPEMNIIKTFLKIQFREHPMTPIR